MCMDVHSECRVQYACISRWQSADSLKVLKQGAGYDFTYEAKLHLGT